MMALEGTRPGVAAMAIGIARAAFDGFQGLCGVRSLLLGGVSNAGVHYADRPALVIHRPTSGPAD